MYNEVLLRFVEDLGDALDIFVGPEIDYKKYLEIYYDVVDKLASELEKE